MADKFLTLYDINKRNVDADGQAVGLIEEVNTYAPELSALKGEPISGIAYQVRKRTALPAGPAFRNANEGSDIISSTYSNDLSQCFFLDGQMRIDEMTVNAGNSVGNAMEDIFSDEMTGVMQQRLINVGDQFYRGTTANAKGFPGLKSLYDATNCELDATGTPGSATSVWLLWNDTQGLRWIFGKGGLLSVGQWDRIQVTDANSKAYYAWTNNVSGWLGLAIGHSRSIVRIKNVTSATGKTCTDSLIAQAQQKLPIFMRRSPNLRIFMNSTAELQLRQSRSTVSTSKTDSFILQFAPPVTESNGIPVIITDSIPNNE